MNAYKIVVAVLFGSGFLFMFLKAWAFARWKAWGIMGAYAFGAAVQLAMFYWTLVQ